MYLSPNRYTELHQTGMQSLIEVVHAQLAALERLSTLNLSVGRSAFYGCLAAVGIKPHEHAQDRLAVLSPGMAEAGHGYSGSMRKSRKSGKGGKGNTNQGQPIRVKQRRAA